MKFEKLIFTIKADKKICISIIALIKYDIKKKQTENVMILIIKIPASAI